MLSKSSIIFKINESIFGVNFQFMTYDINLGLQKSMQMTLHLKSLLYSSVYNKIQTNPIKSVGGNFVLKINKTVIQNARSCSVNVQVSGFIFFILQVVVYILYLDDSIQKYNRRRINKQKVPNKDIQEGKHPKKNKISSCFTYSELQRICYKKTIIR